MRDLADPDPFCNKMGPRKAAIVFEIIDEISGKTSRLRDPRELAHSAFGPRLYWLLMTIPA